MKSRVDRSQMGPSRDQLSAGFESDYNRYAMGRGTEFGSETSVPNQWRPEGDGMEQGSDVEGYRSQRHQASHDRGRSHSPGGYWNGRQGKQLRESESWRPAGNGHSPREKRTEYASYGSEQGDFEDNRLSDAHNN